MDVYDFIKSMKDCDQITCDGIACPDCPLHHPEKGCILNGLIECYNANSGVSYIGIITIGNTIYGITDYRVPNKGEKFLTGDMVCTSDGDRVALYHILEEIE